MIGYTHGQQVYKLLDLKCCTVFSSRHVWFNEEEALAPSETNPWNTHTTDNTWEGLTPAHLHILENTYPDVDDDKPDTTPKEPAEAVGENQPLPPAMQIENIEAVGDQCPHTPEAQVWPEEPRTPPWQVMQRPRSPPPRPRRSGRERKPADRNRDYQRTLDEEANRKATVENAPEPEPDNAATPGLDIPGAFTSEILDNETFFAGVANTGPSNDDLPPNLREAFSRPDGDLWRSALEEELLSLNSNHVYETVPIPAGVTPITSKPVFWIKYDQTGKVERYKVWIVARGC